jgi:MOSC domain-containing protein
MAGDVVGRVIGLHRYPVKSMGGETLRSAEVTVRGVLGDRAYALVDEETGRVVSGKRPRQWAAVLEHEAAFATPPEADRPLPAVRVTLPGGATLSSDDDAFDDGMSAAFGRRVRLASVPAPGASFEYHWPDMPGLVYKGREHRDEITVHEMPAGTFFDGSILHLLTTASLDEMRTRAPGSDFDASRFRPNLLIEPTGGASGFVENDWVGHTLRIGAEVEVEITKRCLRCVMTTLPHDGLPKDPAVLRAAFTENEGHIGVNGLVARPGRVSLGDEVALA